MKKRSNYEKGEGLYEAVYKVVKKIPKGSVATYGQIAEKLNYELGSKNYGKRVTPRIVGFALHANKDSKVPCHRVVNKDGKLAENFAFDGWMEQKRRLKLEGVGFSKEKFVDFEKHLWMPKR